VLPTIPTLNHIEHPVPASLYRLMDFAYNLWWSWSETAASLWAALDADRWERTHNPLDVIFGIEAPRWAELEQLESVVERYRDAVGSYDTYMHDPDTWYRRQGEGLSGPIGYLCTEFGIHASVPFYSGGLGVLAGDHVKSASDLGLPFVAVGLLYRRGYFRQEIDADGDQLHHAPILDLERLPVRPVAARTGGQLKVTVDVPGRSLTVAVWSLAVGRVHLLLLDTDVAENHPADRPITHTLYVRGREMRFLQELVLGVGGVRALTALGIEPAVWHANEGHAALSVLERTAAAMEDGLDLEQARQHVRSRSLFTLHTPVPAGNEKFDRSIPDKYLGPWAERLGTSLDGLAGLASSHGDDQFDMGALAIRFSSIVNGVSKRHAEVVTRDWSWLIGGDAAAVTNGVHAPTWLGRGAGRLLRNQYGRVWPSAILEDPALLKALDDVPHQELWDIHTRRKSVLARFIRGRLRLQFARHGASPDDLRAVDDLFSTDMLTLGFARRFATYKRATLMFRDVHRLATIVRNPDRPIQLVFAGKAHPADDHGQALIRHLVDLSRMPELRGHMFVVENYDARLARFLVQGCDVWVNNPRPPMEASGTSGMKAAMNGVPNLSILDGWWDEGYEEGNGWSFGGRDENPDHEAADAHDADDFYRILADEVAPTFYDRDLDDIPLEWVGIMRRAIATSLVQFSSHRMVADYVDLAYRPLGS
jgi:glycogen phosphorylase